MKKLFALVLVLAMVLACTAALAEEYTIYLVTMDLEDMHWVSVDQGAQAAVAEAKEAGVDIRYVWVGPTVGKNDAAQIECINNAYADNADVILLASNGPETEVATIEQYDADGVKFIYVDSPANSPVALCTLATDNTEAGRMAAWLIENGVDEARVFVENRSMTTAQNAIFTFQILAENAPQVKQLAIISSDYHIFTGALLFGAQAVLTDSDIRVTSNAAWKAPAGSLSATFQAGALIELSGDVETAYDIYFETYDIHELPSREAVKQ